MTVHPIPNGSPAFYAARRGCLTASTINMATARRGGGWGISRTRLLAKLVKERLTGRVERTFCSADMRWGIEHELDAREAYAERIGRDVIPGGFVLHPHRPYVGASPDGFVVCDIHGGVKGVVEIKCLQTKAFDSVAIKRCVPSCYRKQIAWQMSVTAAEWCDFVVWRPRRPLIVLRVMREEMAGLIATLEDQATGFLEEAALLENNLRPYFERKAYASA
jgi:putative phage-type endonuclease